DRAVDEAEAWPAGVLLAQPEEGLLALPEIQHASLERVVIRLVRQACEHGAILGKGFSPPVVELGTCNCNIDYGRTNGSQRHDRDLRPGGHQERHTRSRRLLG